MLKQSIGVERNAQSPFGTIWRVLWAILICEHNSTFRSSFTLTRIKKLERERGRGHGLLGKPMPDYRTARKLQDSRMFRMRAEHHKKDL